jgi:ribonuclease BN (tRNA processing enzyme)
MSSSMNRRELLTAALGLYVVPSLPQLLTAQSVRTRLILLGTGGGPRPRKTVSASAQVIVVNDTLYVVDCGDGVARQLVSAGVSLMKLRHVFITHQHSDHNADYGNLILMAWFSGLQRQVETWGPPPLARMTKLFFEMNSYDINMRIKDEGLTPLVPLVRPHELSKGAVVMQDDNVKVTATLVDHPLVSPAFAYRFDGPDRSIVISGDTARSEALVRLAQGADVLVHEALWVPAVDQIVASAAHASSLKQHIIASHTAAEDCGRVAEAAGVKTLVLSHLVPPDNPQITDQMWIDAASKYFRGRIVVGKDLMEI